MQPSGVKLQSEFIKMHCFALGMFGATSASYGNSQEDMRQQKCDTSALVSWADNITAGQGSNTGKTRRKVGGGIHAQ